MTKSNVMKTRGPWTLSEGLTFTYQQGHLRINQSSIGHHYYYALGLSNTKAY